MRCDNKSIIKIIPLLYFLIIAALLVTNVIGFQTAKIDPTYPMWLCVAQSLLLILFFVYIYQNAQYFEFDGTGEVLVFLNKGTFLSNFLTYRISKAEFPKSRLKFYEVRDFFIFRSLVVYITSRQMRTKKLTFNITFLNYKKQKLIMETLSEISQKNKGTLNGHR